ncbi:hypothetical protein C0Q70_00612 [Pomacea canaliculata]|uniref:G-patch domain-containing protein n=1 Tax=Pomacea canaliculata TaxID=400727 RepID=A0A2T7PX96_POMCA|nr:G patch domain and ankyrin repeat-containing protein 1 homolog [Pomacea canaliculata]PVD38007.1 hypothetical protein C0Q70_00612 [Pomacea canaliculata]
MAFSATNREHAHLIEFVKPEDNPNGHRERSLRQNPALVKQISLGGDEARSFYEELLSLPASVSLKTAKACETEQQGNQWQQECEDKRLKKSKNERSKYVKNDCDNNKAMKLCATGIIEVGKTSSKDAKAKLQTSMSPRPWMKVTANCQKHHSLQLLTQKEAKFLWCSQNGEVEPIQNLISLGININVSDMFGWTAAMCAAFEGHSEVLKCLVDSGADLSQTNNAGQTAVQLAQSRGHSSVVHFIEKIQRERRDGTLQPHINTPVLPNVKFYCDVCQIQCDNKKTHLTSTVHLFNVGLKPRDHAFLIPPSNVGYRMLLKSGWEDNRGLGPYGQGQKYPVKTCLKRDRKGLGNKNGESKITHFQPYDTSAVHSVHSIQKSSQRKPNVRTLSRKEQRRKERKERLWEMEMRRALT